MKKKTPPKNLSPTTLAFMSELNECQLRHYLAECALNLGRHGVSKISEKMGYCKNTIRKGIRELLSGYTPGEGRVRRLGWQVIFDPNFLLIHEPLDVSSLELRILQHLFHIRHILVTVDFPIPYPPVDQ